jgi:CPA2 family monovalent cation:H+ antiporter-2
MNGLSHNNILSELIPTFLLFFGIAGLLVPLLQRLKIPPMLGYLFCGLAVGPYGLVLFADTIPLLAHLSIKDRYTVEILGELGIITLMFRMGLELSLERLKQLKHYIFGLGSLQILLTAIVIYIIARMFDNSVQAAVLLGASFALSSTAIVMRILEERKLSSRPVGILCFSVLLMQDLAVIPILVLAASFSGEQTGNIPLNIPLAMASSLALGGATIIGMYFLGHKVLTPVLRLISKAGSPEWLAAFVVFMVLGCAMLTSMAGLSLALGAFMAGLLLGETAFRHEVEVIFNPLKGMLLGIFFLSIGMMINLGEVLRYPAILLLSVLGIYALKAFIIIPLCLAFRVPGQQAAQAAVYLAQPGEFALLILGVSLTSGLIPAHHAQFFLLVTIVAMAFTPVLCNLAPIAGNWGHRLLQAGETVTTPPASTAHNVVIAGFGRVGQLIANALEAQRIPYVAFDNNALRIEQAQKTGGIVLYGDARRKELWQHLMHENIQVAVIAIDDHEATRHILKSLRRQFPLLPVIVRAKDTIDTNALYNNGANYVVAETRESSLRIVQLLLKQLGI